MARDRVLVAMSGGVDSTVAAALLRDAGFDCEGVTLRLADIPGANGGGAGEDAIEDARAAALHLNMPLRILDFREPFRREVVDRFAAAYLSGETPNPCVECNRRVKFGHVLAYAAEQGFGAVATGHYVRVSYAGVRGCAVERSLDAGHVGRWLLRKAADETKDQSYMLYALTQAQLARVMFPLGEYTKAAVREIARLRELPNARRPDSQDICFVPDGDYAAFIEAHTGEPRTPGPFIDSQGAVVGRHGGAVRYTIGQRKGLGLSMNAPVYVYKKSMEQNAVYVGGETMLYARSLTARDINLIACPAIDGTLRVRAKTRYRQPEQPATVRQTGPDEIRVEFDEPQRAITPGQAVVFYDGDVVVGGGTILLDQ